ncbi:MAG: hypothetical protein JOS17DRAFT_335000 [Linnemannia elongata]|nr:MAG: hypothetical protein JOS17DRAFT_335000 [Linnemannia elongata]
MTKNKRLPFFTFFFFLLFFALLVRRFAYSLVFSHLKKYKPAVVLAQNKSTHALKKNNRSQGRPCLLSLVFSFPFWSLHAPGLVLQEKGGTMRDDDEGEEGQKGAKARQGQREGKK